MATFCQREVEPMGVECDHVQIAGLCEYLCIHVDIIYLDSSGSSPTMRFPEAPAGAPELLPSSFPAITLLYRPGHYDLLYR